MIASISNVMINGYYTTALLPFDRLRMQSVVIQHAALCHVPIRSDILSQILVSFKLNKLTWNCLYNQIVVGPRCSTVTILYILTTATIGGSTKELIHDHQLTADVFTKNFIHTVIQKREFETSNIESYSNLKGRLQNRTIILYLLIFSDYNIQLCHLIAMCNTRIIHRRYKRNSGYSNFRYMCMD